MIVAETERLRIRKMTLDDAEFVYRLTNDPTFLAGIGDRGVRSIDDARRWLREGHWIRQEKPGHGQFVVELRASGEPIGICGLLYRPPLDVTDIGFALLAEHHGRGYAIEAARAVLDYGYRELGLDRIHGLVSHDNPPSVRVLEKLGLRFERRVRMDPEAEQESALYS